MSPKLPLYEPRDTRREITAPCTDIVRVLYFLDEWTGRKSTGWTAIVCSTLAESRLGRRNPERVPDPQLFRYMNMPGHECYHCKQWVEQGEAHDCWTTTEAALTQDLSEDLQDAWERLRESSRVR
jgi:hypothetical protein